MKKAEFEALTVIIIILAAIVLALIISYYYFSNNHGATIKVEGNETIENKNYCSEESRNAVICVEDKQEVCGWFDSSIKCLKYPCAENYKNPCYACLNSNIEYWVNEECPKS